MVTDINPASLGSWTGAGPLPRARARTGSAGSTGNMTKHVESVHVEPWEVSCVTAVSACLLGLRCLRLYVRVCVWIWICVWWLMPVSCVLCIVYLVDGYDMSLHNKTDRIYVDRGLAATT